MQSQTVFNGKIGVDFLQIGSIKISVSRLFQQNNFLNIAFITIGVSRRIVYSASKRNMSVAFILRACPLSRGIKGGKDSIFIDVNLSRSSIGIIHSQYPVSPCCDVFVDASPKEGEIVISLTPCQCRILSYVGKTYKIVIPVGRSTLRYKEHCYVFVGLRRKIISRIQLRWRGSGGAFAECYHRMEIVPSCV